MLKNNINNAQLDNGKYIGIVIPMYNLIEYSDNYSKTSGHLCQYYTDEPFWNGNDDIADFPANNNNSASLHKK